MKLMNYDKKDLVYQNVHDIREVSEVPQNYTQTQIKILRRLIQQKQIKEQFFIFLLESCYDISYYAELGGFRLGMKYAVKILTEILEK